MPSSEWPTPEAIEAVAARLDEAGWTHPQTGPPAVAVATDLLTIAAKASPVIPAPKCETCHGKPRYREGTIGPQTVGMEATGRVHICPDCHETGVAEQHVATVTAERDQAEAATVKRITEWLRAEFDLPVDVAAAIDEQFGGPDAVK